MFTNCPLNVSYTLVQMPCNLIEITADFIDLSELFQDLMLVMNDRLEHRYFLPGNRSPDIF